MKRPVDGRRRFISSSGARSKGAFHPETKVEVLQEELGSPAGADIFIFTVIGPSMVRQDLGSDPRATWTTGRRPWVRVTHVADYVAHLPPRTPPALPGGGRCCLNVIRKVAESCGCERKGKMTS